jgi:hypothetical protein
MGFFRKRVRAKRAGQVVSVKRGTRTRVTVQPIEGEAVDQYFVTDTRIKIGKRVSKGSALGKI